MLPSRNPHADGVRMRKWVPILPVVLLAAIGVALAALGPVNILAGETVSETWNGQTLEMTSDGVSTSVEFSEVSSTKVSGTVRRTAGTSGTFTITWTNRGITKKYDITPTNPQRMFTLEGGDGDKRDPGQVAP
jgi:hypothetical protein